jgi:hypothetical protein
MDFFGYQVHFRIFEKRSSYQASCGGLVTLVFMSMILTRVGQLGFAIANNEEDKVSITKIVVYPNDTANNTMSWLETGMHTMYTIDYADEQTGEP